jgi:hypothetical protein
MKRFRLPVLLFVLLAATFVTVSVAAGGNGGGAASTTPFKAQYFNGQGGYFTCSGAHIEKTGPKAFVKDSETCAMSDVSTWPAGTYPIVPPPPPSEAVASWYSDSPLIAGTYAVSGTIVVTDNGDGTGTMQITAYY